MKGAAATVRASYRSWLARPRSAVTTQARRRLRQVRDRYRHSLQLRVITATLILSAVVVTVLGYILMQHLVAGIYANAQHSAEEISNAGLATAANSGNFGEPPNSGSLQDMYLLAQNLKSTEGTPYAVEVTLLPQFQGPPVYSSGDAVGFYRSLPQFPGKADRRRWLRESKGRGTWSRSGR